jgi:DNA-binding NarL/FixJ family response regulator
VICELLEAGVAAVLPHAELTCETLLNTVRAVLTGVAVVPAASMPRVLQHARATGRQVPGALSDREREVLKWLAEGSDTREIASELCFSERTVKNVVHDILMKLNCRTRAHAVALATRSGVI